MTADEIIAALKLRPHPEGGHYVETFRDAPGPDGRSRSTAIYFLLRAGERSHWHRVDAVEIWHFHAGAPLLLSIAETAGAPVQQITLGHGVTEGHRPQGIVPPHHWQAAESLGDWTLVGCTVAPGFDFAGFELAPSDWSP
ncbi:MAG: cupin domain-containing protein [Ferrovibrio sp.]|uniref:cupin domain-containing protein n=1 Tax=Ferrovibrio sp. TaxID=1917215 RepID=UPI00391CCCF0